MTVSHPDWGFPNLPLRFTLFKALIKWGGTYFSWTQSSHDVWSSVRRLKEGTASLASEAAG
ncbi:hypothetical protein Pyn_22569 [Prunus yedoensis var. nudiflora]|uniref:Uncharacterized protein n=1 Tax=Prunus yedoensis var. nudiflora TaxID=2094558 RepID=A0A314ZQV2_PRUYE|nr:hypothetical protein Pyn_22569 [Prunus yedoensis var. nudiflora]